MIARYQLLQIARQLKNRIRKMRPIQSNEGIESEYYSFLRNMILKIKKEFLNVAVRHMKKESIKEQWQDEDYSALLDRLILQISQGIRNDYNENALNEVIQRFIFKTDKYHSFWYRKAAMYGFGIDISKLPEFEGYRSFLKQKIDKNLSIIKNLREDTLYKIEMSLRTAIEQGKSIGQLQAEISGSSDLSKRRAAVIARNEIKNITSQLNQKRAENAGFDIYEWMTAEDQRVRGNPSGLYPNSKTNHWIMNGMFCKYSDDSVYSDNKGKTWKKRTAKMPKGKPGEEINCRCVDIPIQ